MERWSFLGFYGLLSLFMVDEAFGQPRLQSSQDIGTSGNEYHWSPWTGWAGCTRPCDAGALRQRTCLKHGTFSAVPNDLCEGQNKEYRACNTRPCTTRMLEGFRARQCSFFDRDIKYNGETYQWKPYYAKEDDDYNPCSLECYAEEDPTLVISFPSSVLEGTPCKARHHKDKAICVSGKCESIGCDDKLYSTSTVDQCGVCGGNGTTCRTVRNNFNQVNISKGYTEIVKIPRGSVHIRIVEKDRNDQTFLALKSGGTDGHYYINGHRHIDAPLKYEIAGTVIHYNRPTDYNNETIESLTARGPTSEPLVLLVLARESSPVHILYHYTSWNQPVTASHVLSERPQTNLNNLDWLSKHGELRAGDFADLYGGEGEMREILESDLNLSESLVQLKVHSTVGPLPEMKEMSSTKRDGPKRDQDKAEEEDGDFGFDVDELYIGVNESEIDMKFLPAYSYYWEATIAPCSATCSPGLSVTYARCLRNNGEVVHESECDTATRPEPKFSKSCRGMPCDARWVASKWSQCSVTCGKGVQYRSVRCWRMLAEGLDSSVSHLQCDESNKPSNTQPCETPECGPLWETSEWSECSRQCGPGIRERQVRCSLPDNNCKLDSKPAEEESCFGRCQAVWGRSKWSECTKPCDTKRRDLHCLNKNTGGLVGPDQCDSHQRPLSIHPCSNECDPMWIPQPWQQCTMACTKNRRVLCVESVQGESVVESQSCDESSKPEETTTCSEGVCGMKPQWFSTQWSQCSKSCGKGVRTRETTCYLNDQPATGCRRGTKPQTVEECVEAACPAETPEDCKDDNNTKCTLAVGLDLCDHWYYKRACCNSCAEQERQTRDVSDWQLGR